ncbi:hypothetical protein DFJ58DRAFT_729028 [Suillus subalutaceus]|uniref:uncharacterized protein n=1 Tax=Suillus subalutaceus TaxID=48586 RepID=UPI001B872B4F|nr:uncharacterized protein DFJ58DRAFT_729028 [Suillus subalutaceus]KAG1851047.1 hypothetical protein DFJ58DRAFT_729028 [Suillus subalutaceus]
MPIAPKNHFWLDTRLDMFENQHSSGVGVIVAVAGTDGDENAGWDSLDVGVACVIVSFRKKLARVKRTVFDSNLFLVIEDRIFGVLGISIGLLDESRGRQYA